MRASTFVWFNFKSTEITAVHVHVAQMHQMHANNNNNNNNEPLIVSAALMKCFVQWTRTSKTTLDLNSMYFRWFLGFAVTTKFPKIVNNCALIQFHAILHYLKRAIERWWRQHDPAREKKNVSRNEINESQLRPVPTKSNIDNSFGERGCVHRASCNAPMSHNSKYYF